MNQPRSKFYGSLFIIFFLAACKPQPPASENMDAFGEQYTEAWNSKIPGKMASFYAEDGSLTVNNGTPSTGRPQIAATAQTYMAAFPDMHLTMDSLVEDKDSYRYHWTFTGTNTGPRGTGNKVVFSGFERWTMNEQSLIQNSVGTYDAEDYNRQLNALNLTTAQAYNQVLAYAFEDYVTIDLTFSSDTTLYWKERTSGAEANEHITTIHMNDHTTLTGWTEYNKTIVSLYSDFKVGETFGYQYFSDGSIRKLIGTISNKQ